MVKSSRIAAATLFALALSIGPARADLRPDPVDPTGPFGLIYLVLLIVAGAGFYYYRRRR
ncbi:MAG: hypothetical protein ABL973_20370 [Micropepsaceae bacterium]